MDVVIGGYVWLPADQLSPTQRTSIEKDLTVRPRVFEAFGDNHRPDLELYKYEERNGKDCIGVPWAWYKRNVTQAHKETLELTSGAAMRPLASTIKFDPPFQEQKIAIAALEAHFRENPWGGAILQAGCGFGKSEMAIELARRLGRATLIVVHKTMFLRQWRKRIEKVCPDAKIGLIQQNTCDFEGKDFVIASIQSLERSLKTDKYPRAMWSYFGLVIGDEVHRTGAESWSGVIPEFRAKWRMGLTATPRRKDGCERAFFDHIGRIAYAAKTQMLLPKIRHCSTGTRVYGFGGKDPSPSMVIKQLTDDGLRNQMISDQITLAAMSGRKVLIVSERISHLRDLFRLTRDEFDRRQKNGHVQEVPTADFYTAQWYENDSPKAKLKPRGEKEWEIAERAQLVFATKQLVEEGLDIASLDTVVIATPISDAEQTVGRIRRSCLPPDPNVDPDRKKCLHLCPWRATTCQGKPHPVVVDIVDPHVPRSVSSAQARKRFYKEVEDIAAAAEKRAGK